MIQLRRTGTGLRAVLLATSLGTALHGGASIAQPREERQPPPFAYTACEGHAEGAACEVTFGDRTITGTCGLDRSQRLFCRPTNMPPPPPREG